MGMKRGGLEAGAAEAGAAEAGAAEAGAAEAGDDGGELVFAGLYLAAGNESDVKDREGSGLRLYGIIRRSNGSMTGGLLSASGVPAASPSLDTSSGPTRSKPLPLAS